MRTGLLLLVSAAVLGGLVGTLMLRDPGYVLVAYAGRIMETSVWFAFALLIVLYALLRCIVFMASRLIQGKSLLGAWRERRIESGARRQTLRGLLLYGEGQWADAKTLLAEAAQRAAMPLVNYLHAARAANELGDSAGRDELLARARETTPQAAAAVLLTRAELQMAAEQWEDSRATLLELREMSPRHPRMLDLLRQCHEHLEDWPAILELLPDLRRARAVDAEALAALERRAWAHRLEAAGDAETWQRLPKELKRDPEITLARVRSLAANGEHAAAERAARKALDRTWHDGLVEWYGRIPSPDLKRQLATAENWLDDHPDDAGLLLALGRIAMMDGAWAKAREYLEASLRLEPSSAVYGELGRLLNHLGEFIRGSEYLGKACAELPDLPLPPRPGR